MQAWSANALGMSRPSTDPIAPGRQLECSANTGTVQRVGDESVAFGWRGLALDRALSNELVQGPPPNGSRTQCRYPRH